ncbi:universal stress protein [Halobacteriaceae archaeon GCM10025711]
MYDDILLPTDGSDGADAALDHAIDLARRYDATLHVLYVADTARYSTVTFEDEVVDVLASGEMAVQEVVERAEADGVTVVDVVEQGDPVRTILDYVDQYDIDLVVMPTHGRRGADRLLLGSVTEKVIRAAKVPVFTVQFD